MRVRLFEGGDVFQVFPGSNVQRGFVGFVGLEVVLEAEGFAFKLVAFPPGRFLGLGCGASCSLAFSLALLVPLYVVPALGKGFPVVPAFLRAGDADEPPLAVCLDSFEDVDASHDCLPVMDNIADNMACKQLKTKAGELKLAFCL